MDKDLTKNEKLFMVLMLLDIIEGYAIEVLPNMKFELKQAINKAIVANRQMTKKADQLLSEVGNEFGIVSDDVKEIIEKYYKGEFDPNGVNKKKKSC